MKRQLKTSIEPLYVKDGAGVRIKRLFPVAGFEQIDPFLLFDHFGSDNTDDFIAGFPMHPHRGIETVTYMLEGRVNHRDSTGREGSIEAGDVQWMSSGRGIMHEEMPEVADGRLSGFQLWVNLPAKDKMNKPAYQEYKAGEITEFTTEQGHKLRLISGNLLGRQGMVNDISTQPIYADIHMVAGELVLDLPEIHNAFLYVYNGDLSIISEKHNISEDYDISKEYSEDKLSSDESQPIKAPRLAVLSQGKTLHIKSEHSAHFMLAAGKPINEPAARWGPFVMNTREEINQTLQELQRGEFPPE